MANKNSGTQERTILIPDIDAVKEKNLFQLNGLGQRGCRFIILTADATGRSSEVVGSSNNVELRICPRRWRRSWYVLSLIRILFTTKIDLAEVYPDYPLQLMLGVLIKCARIPIVIVARGAEHQYVTGRMARLRSLAFRLTYFLADYVIYKELYMEDMLVKMGKKKRTFLSNAVSIPVSVNQHDPDKCHFIFLNSIKYFRHPEVALKAFLRICREYKLTSQSKIRFSIIGFRGESVSGELAQKEANLRSLVTEKDVPIELHPWTNNPRQWLADADVFLLPADIVFLNYSLLEAMARGIPVIVQETFGSDMIVSHGHDGFILPLDEKKWEDHMRRCIEDSQMRKEMGRAAREKIIKNFSVEEYAEKYDSIYRRILSKN